MEHLRLSLDFRFPTPLIEPGLKLHAVDDAKVPFMWHHSQRWFVHRCERVLKMVSSEKTVTTIDAERELLPELDLQRLGYEATDEDQF